MKVGTKLNVAFGVIIFIMLCSAVFNYFNFNKIQKQQEEEMTNIFNAVMLVDEIRLNLSDQGLYLRAYFLEQTEENKNHLLESAKKVDEYIVNMEDFAVNKETKDLIEELNLYNEDFNIALEKALLAIENNEDQQALELINGPLEEANNELSSLAEVLIEGERSTLEKEKKTVVSIIELSKIIAGIILFAGLIVVIVVTILVKYKIVNPLLSLKKSANEMAKGNFKIEDIETKESDEIAELSKSFNNMKKNIRDLIANVQDSSLSLSSSAEQLSASSEQVSHSSDEIFSQLSDAHSTAKLSAHSSYESAKAMEETAQGIQRIAESTQVLNSKALCTNEKANEGMKIVILAKGQVTDIYKSTKDINSLVDTLSKQSEEIQTITDLIKEITDQTNLLALNASIEAARAGEHGKGFAVVANEVKKLAENSKSAANSISDLTKSIKEGTDKVSLAVNESMDLANKGVEVITHSEEAFEEILSNVETITSQVQEISATTEELSASAEEVTASVSEIASGANLAAEGLQEVSSKTKQQVETMKTVNDVAYNLAKNSSDLQEELNKFKV